MSTFWYNEPQLIQDMDPLYYIPAYWIPQPPEWVPQPIWDSDPQYWGPDPQQWVPPPTEDWGPQYWMPEPSLDLEAEQETEQQAEQSSPKFSLSPTAPEFVPSGGSLNDGSSDDDGEDDEKPSIIDIVTGFFGNPRSSSASFNADVEELTSALNMVITTEESLKELVEMIYSQSTGNLCTTGARVCNHLSGHLTFSPPSGNFRQLLLKRCRLDYEQRDAAIRGDAETQREFHSFVSFLGQLYLHLEVKSSSGPPTRADILLTGLKDLVHSLLSSPGDANITCAVELLKATGCMMEEVWSKAGKPHMNEIVDTLERVLLEGDCSRDVRQTIVDLLKWRFSNWGRINTSADASDATPDNGPDTTSNNGPDTTSNNDPDATSNNGPDTTSNNGPDATPDSGPDDTPDHEPDNPLDEIIFYTEDGIPFRASDPDADEKIQDILDSQDYFDDLYPETETENENEEYEYEVEIELEIIELDVEGAEDQILFNITIEGLD